MIQRAPVVFPIQPSRPRLLNMSLLKIHLLLADLMHVGSKEQAQLEGQRCEQARKKKETKRPVRLKNEGR
jgi:hypothetical protein